MPTSLLKSCSDIFAVIIALLANLSFRDGLFPACLKTAEVLPLLQKTDGADRADPANYRPISNLSTISKVLERLALAATSVQFCEFLSISIRFPYRSLYRNSAAGAVERRLLSWRRQTLHCRRRSRHRRRVRHYQS